MLFHITSTSPPLVDLLSKKIITRLKSYGENFIPVLGTCTLTVNKSNISHVCQFFVVSLSDAKPLLSLKSCKLLDILNINDVEIDKSNILKQYSDLFTGLGLVKGSYHITVAKNAVPVIHAPREVPMTILPKLKSTLDCLEKAIVF